jgi:LacI family transcriptional regulator, galactose operon repressor
MTRKRITLADVARAAGVSQTAASFVLSGRREEMRISAEVEERVLRAARETGYRPNIVSRGLRTGTTQTIGFVSDTVATAPYAGHLIWGALDAAREHGHLLFIAETEGDPELEQQLIDAMHDRQVDGIVLASMYTRRINPPQALLEGPAVLLNALPANGSTRLPSILPDEAEAGRTAARVLLEAGHADGIHLVGAGPGPAHGPEDSVAAVERLQGIMEAIGAAGMEIAGAVGCSEWQPDKGFEATQQILRGGTTPSALICFNDRLALGAYQALAEAGLDVPGDVSVVSFDDDVIASWIKPQLTTLALPHYELGRTAIEVLLAQRGEPPNEQAQIHRIPMPLRERGSIRRLESSRSAGRAASADPAGAARG